MWKHISFRNVVDESEPLEVKGHFKDPNVCIWDCDVGPLLQADTFIFTHCRMYSKYDQHEWVSLHLSESSTVASAEPNRTEPPGYQSFKKPMECIFQSLVYTRDCDKPWKNSTNLEFRKIIEEFALSRFTFSRFGVLTEGFRNGMINFNGRVALEALLELLKSFIHVNEKYHYLYIYNFGGSGLTGGKLVKFYMEPDRIANGIQMEPDSIAKGTQPKKRKRKPSDCSSPSTSECSLPAPLSRSTSSESECDYGAPKKDQEQVSSGIRRDLQKYFVPDVVLTANSVHRGEALRNILTVSVKHGEIDLQTVRQLQCEILPLVVKHNIALGLLINAWEAYMIKLVNINGKITRYEEKYVFPVARESDFCEYFNVEQFNWMCVHIINDCQKVYDAYSQ